MRNVIFLLFFGILILCSTSVQSSAQSLIDDNLPTATDDAGPKNEKNSKSFLKRSWQLKRGAVELTTEHGNAPFNPSNFAGPKEYNVYGRDLYLANYRYGRVLGTRKGITYQYLIGFTPVALFTRNEVRNSKFISREKTPDEPETVRQRTYGVGIQPLNFRFIFLPKKRLKPYAQTGAGIILTTRSMPVPRSTPFNFTGDFGGGVLFMVTENKAANIGYRYFHISNGNIGGKINNPGYNANVFYFSYSFFK